MASDFRRLSWLLFWLKRGTTGDCWGRFWTTSGWAGRGWLLLALAGLFLPWFRPGGVLTGHTFDAYDVVRIGAALDALDVSAPVLATAWAMQIIVVGVAVSAVWLILLARRRKHPLHRAARGFLLLATPAAIALGLAIGFGIGTGLMLVAVAAALVAAPPGATRAQARASWLRRAPSPAIWRWRTRRTDPHRSSPP